MVDARITRHADKLVGSYKTGLLLPQTPSGDMLEDFEQAYAVQELVASGCGMTSAGWKLGCTNETSQRNLGSPGPIAGRMFKERLFESGAVLRDVRLDMLVVEGEFAFEMKKDLPARKEEYDEAEVIDALGALHPAIELVQSRFANPRSPIKDIIADNAGAGSLIIGRPTDSWRQGDLASQVVTLSRPDGEIIRGYGSEVLGDPIHAMTWLANFLSRRGLSLQAGEIVTTGTCFAPQIVAPDVEITADFGPFGTCRLKFQRP